jgi:uncharacterized protein YlxP (DUF503 family)
VTIGLTRLELLIPGARSLKDRRRALKSLKDQMRNRYNCSVAEVGPKEKWARAMLAVCVVSDDSAHVSAQLNEIIRFASTKPTVEVIHYDIETF